MEKQLMDAIGRRWSQDLGRPLRTRWWESPAIMRHIHRKLVSDAPFSVYWGKDILRNTGRTFSRALSVGCGNAFKEISILKSGVVEHFDLFELAPKMIIDAKASADAAGVRERCTFHFGNFFESPKNCPENYDLVFWSGSLHHMFDAREAVRISHSVLKPGGYFYCDEYVGRNHFQYSMLEITIANGVRVLLPQEVFKAPNGDLYPVLTNRPNREQMIAVDPSEAADSENILPAIREAFPQAHIIPLGGVVYNLALMGVLVNIPDDCNLLQELLQIDDDANDHGIYQYAFALARK